MTSLVKDFMKDETRFICGTGPLTEAAKAMLGDSVRDGSFQNVLGSSKITLAEKNLDKAIEAIQSGMDDDVQPACMDPVRNCKFNTFKCCVFFVFYLLSCFPHTIYVRNRRFMPFLAH